MSVELNDNLASTGQPLLAAVFFVLGLRLILGRRFGLPIPGRRGAGAAGQPLVTALQSPASSVPGRAAAWTARGRSTLDPPGAPPPDRPAAPPPGGSPEHGAAVPELIYWGQRAARAGDRLVAYRLFRRALESDRANETAWLWRAATCDRPDEAVHCLEQVLQINPDNRPAQRGLLESKQRPSP